MGVILLGESLIQEVLVFAPSRKGGRERVKDIREQQKTLRALCSILGERGRNIFFFYKMNLSCFVLSQPSSRFCKGGKSWRISPGVQQFNFLFHCYGNVNG